MDAMPLHAMPDPEAPPRGEFNAADDADAMDAADAASSRTAFSHIPVLVEPVLAYVPPGARLLADVTVGGGGHARALLERFPQAELFGCDRDPAAVEAAGRALAPIGARA